MRRPFIAGNWKMHGSRTENAELIEGLLLGMPAEASVEVAVCPPFVYLWEAARLLKSSSIALGAQSTCAEAVGAFTGEVSAAMLKDVGCQYVIVGHSERRALYKEDDALVARKFLAARAQDLTPILCVGETLEEREQGLTDQVVSRQLNAVLDVAGVAAMGTAVIAYEPVWAIGTGKNATPQQAQEVHAHIRAEVGARDANIAAGVRILYGGSVKAANAREIFSMPDVDGGLIGGASLAADEFLKICAAAPAA
ncbi:triosephosphate isomerase [Steroidobacter denitrificans]|uniref:Triosephosphate isomerase n=1 Tax=Steroidobacter denitrificans TaxID=465721 RepID=A0A127F8R4_STEDE|nr:triosephosphate isomerase [Steroidobacter denitrificans]